LDVPEDLLDITAGAAKEWFMAATGTGKVPALAGKIAKGKVGEVRKSLKKGKSAAAADA
jgi:hypothetical protein